jgi:hypothetical protein
VLKHGAGLLDGVERAARGDGDQGDGQRGELFDGEIGGGPGVVGHRRLILDDRTTEEKLDARDARTVGASAERRCGVELVAPGQELPVLVARRFAARVLVEVPRRAGGPRPGGRRVAVQDRDAFDAGDGEQIGSVLVIERRGVVRPDHRICHEGAAVLSRGVGGTAVGWRRRR